MYVYYTEELEEDIVNIILVEGLAVSIHVDDNMYLLSKEKKIVIDGNTIVYDYTLEEYVQMLDGGEYICIQGMEITKMEVISVFTEDLYKTDNKIESYADIIYKSENPYNEINRLIDKFVIVRLEQLEKEFRQRINAMKKQVNKCGIEWK